MSDDYTDIMIRTGDREMLQSTLDQLPGVGGTVMPDAPDDQGAFRVRVYNGLDFVKWAFPRQGYGVIVRELPKEPAERTEHGTGELHDFDPGTGRSSQDDWK
jgi:hypothetical protein